MTTDTIVDPRPAEPAAEAEDTQFAIALRRRGLRR